MTVVTGPARTGSGERGPARILVVDDEVFLSDMVAMALRPAGYRVAQASSGRQALELAAGFAPDLVVLDVMLPDLDGLEVCRRLRATGDDTPVLFLTARDSTQDTLTGLEAGGDDYLTKPFSLAVLVARIRAVLRRTPALRERQGSRMAYADLTLDVDTRRVWRGQLEVELTATEFELLAYLLANAGRVLTRTQLLDAVWPVEFEGTVNVVETYISYLRRKLDPHGPPLIQTVRGVGYSLRIRRTPRPNGPVPGPPSPGPPSPGPPSPGPPSPDPASPAR